MPIERHEQTVVLHGTIGVEEAESLLEQLQASPAAALDLSACAHVHAAALQVLMAAARPVAAWPTDPDLARWLRAALPSATA